MSDTPRRLGRVQKVVTIVPLALLSAAFTASIAGVGVVPASTTIAAGDPDLPDGTTVPQAAIEAPASVSAPGSLAPGVTGDTERIVATSSTNGIPSSALAAYQRAETVINTADKSCNLTWQLIAAIGRVESNHGRFGGNALDDKGVARPGIYGLPLNGANNTSKISDTDAGQYDNDTVNDRAVGPLQFIPSTWSVVGVDADNDGVRNPQDIDDASLATAVYLCSGKDDLGTVAGQRAAVYRYNHSNSYVDLVLSIMNAYLQGDFMTVPDGTITGGVISPYTGATPDTTKSGAKPSDNKQGGGDAGATEGNTTDTGGDTGTDTGGDTGGDTGSNTGGDTGTDTGGNTTGGVDKPKVKLPDIKLPDLPKTGIDPVDKTLTLTQAILQCTLDGYIDNILKTDDPFDQCVVRYTTS